MAVTVAATAKQRFEVTHDGHVTRQVTIPIPRYFFYRRFDVYDSSAAGESLRKERAQWRVASLKWNELWAIAYISRRVGPRSRPQFALCVGSEALYVFAPVTTPRTLMQPL